MKTLISAFAFVFSVSLQAAVSDLNDAWFQKVELEYRTGLSQLAVNHENDVHALLDSITKEAWTSEAFIVRDYLRQFAKTKDLTDKDLVQIPESLVQLQHNFLAEKKKLADKVLGGAQQQIDSAVTEATKNGDLDSAAVLQKKFEELKARLGYTGMSLLNGNASALPSEVTIVKKLSLNISLIGQTTVGLDLEPGEKYRTRGITGDNVVIQVGNDQVTIPISNTDLAARVSAAKKGIKYDPNSTSVDQSVNDSTDSDQAAVATRPAQSSSSIEGRMVTVEVFAAIPWKPTGITIKRGEQYGISYQRGMWSANPQWGRSFDGNGNTSANAGATYAVPGWAEGCLVGKVGNGQPFHIGNQGTTPEGVTGELTIAANDDPHGYYDNSGSIWVTIRRIK